MLLTRFCGGTGDCYLEYDRTTGRYESPQSSGSTAPLAWAPRAAQGPPDFIPRPSASELSYDDIKGAEAEEKFVNGRQVKP